MTKSPARRTGPDWGENENLFALYLRGDASATRDLFESLQAALTAYFRVRVGGRSEAEDLVQVTLMKIHFARDRYDAAKSLKTWVFTIASRSLIDHWRGGNEDLFYDDPEESQLDAQEAPGLSPEEKVRLQTDLKQALESLKPLERSIVYLAGVEGLSLAEIGQIHGLTETAVKLRAHRAYQELRRILAVLVLILWKGGAGHGF